MAVADDGLHVVDASTAALQGPLRIAESAAADLHLGPWSPDGAHVLVQFPSGLAILELEPWIDVIVIFRAPGRRLEIGPAAWAPSGLRVAFTLDFKSNDRWMHGELLTVDVDGTVVNRETVNAPYYRHVLRWENGVPRLGALR